MDPLLPISLFFHSDHIPGAHDLNPHKEHPTPENKLEASAEMSTPPALARRVVAAAMLGPDDINTAIIYTFEALQALPSHLIGRLSFVGYPERHGINALDLLFPKNQMYG